MKEGFIENLYYENLGMQRRCFRPGSSAQKKLEKVVATEDALLKSLTEEQTALFEAFCDAKGDLQTENHLDCFIHGFRMGGQCVYDIFVDTDAPYDFF